MTRPRTATSLDGTLQHERRRDEATARRGSSQATVGPHLSSKHDGIPQGGPLTEDFQGGPYDFTVGEVGSGAAITAVGSYEGGPSQVYSDLYAQAGALASRTAWVQNDGTHAEATDTAEILDGTAARAKQLAATPNHEAILQADDDEGFAGVVLSFSTSRPTGVSNPNNVVLYLFDNGGTKELRAIHNDVDVVVASW